MSYTIESIPVFFFFSSRRRHTRYIGDWSSDVCSSDLPRPGQRLRGGRGRGPGRGRAAREYISLLAQYHRSEERRVGKECRSRWSTAHEKKRNEEKRRYKTTIRM